MDKTIVIGLGGRPERYRFDEDAYERLARYLDQAAARLEDESDRAEVLGDLERSVGDRLTGLLQTGDRQVTALDIEGIIAEIGAVDTGHEPRMNAGDPRPRKRRLYRIREGQQIAGVCTGLAAYAELDVAWVRTLFVLGTVFTAGFLGLVYVAFAFILPVAAKRDAYDM